MENTDYSPDPNDPIPPDNARTKADPPAPRFEPAVLDRTVIAMPLLEMMATDGKKQSASRTKAQRAVAQGKPTPNPTAPVRYNVIIDLNLRFDGDRDEAAQRVAKLIKDVAADLPDRSDSSINEATSQFSQQYIFARLHGDVIQEIVRRDEEAAQKDGGRRAIHRIWPDFKIQAFINKSISTIKADAAHYSFSALGKDIVWAVMDSGIDRTHRHFQLHTNLHPNAKYHTDFTGTGDPFRDDFGHGTHVAGIIAGEVVVKEAANATQAEIDAGETSPIVIVSRQRDEQGVTAYVPENLTAISGMAPRCKLVSLKVLDQDGGGQASSLIAAIAKIQEVNGYGRDVKIHGVNLSLGYNFEPEWFACGQSPLCVEVDRLVKSGVVVVVAAGNTGYGVAKSMFRGNVAAGMTLSINDPGNAELAITVGSTHRDSPHTYGVSYFSSKGPTGDGRLKPDLLAPGEKIVSCAAGAKKTSATTDQPFEYIEDSGTSMAAPHVSGVIAAFLSIRREYIGNPEAVKDLFLSSATDLKRDRYFQGHGLIDLMRAIQSV